MAFKMKKPVFYNVGNEYKEQNTSAVFQQKKKKKKKEKKTSYKKKTLEDYLNEGFSQVEAEQMLKEGATTGHDYLPNDDDKK